MDFYAGNFGCGDAAPRSLGGWLRPDYVKVFKGIEVKADLLWLMEQKRDIVLQGLPLRVYCTVLIWEV